MTSYIAVLSYLIVLANVSNGFVYLNEKLVKIESKDPDETDFNAITVTNPDKIVNLSISYTFILNANYTPLKKFSNLKSFNLTEVIGAPRITKDFFQNFPKLKDFIIFASEIYNEVEFEEDALYYADKLELFFAEGIYTVARLSNRFLGKSLKNLKRLTVDNGAISVIEANAFDFTENLEYLSITDHGRIKIEKGAFRKLTKLEDLYLSGNYIEDFSWDTFGLMPSVKFLTLSEVNPKEIDANKIIKHFPKLTIVMVYTSNCKEYVNVVRSDEIMIAIVKLDGNPCFADKPL